jgi:hypothetical protein
MLVGVLGVLIPGNAGFQMQHLFGVYQRVLVLAPGLETGVASILKSATDIRLHIETRLRHKSATILKPASGKKGQE